MQSFRGIGHDRFEQLELLKHPTITEGGYGLKGSIAGRERTDQSRAHTKRDKASRSIKDEVEDQFGVINGLVQRTQCDGCRPSMRGMAAKLSAMHPAARREAALSLQSARGNRFLQRLAIQAKLTVGQPNDKYENEADRVANQVMAAPEHSTVSGEPLHIQRYAGQASEPIDPAVSSIEQVLDSPGRPLEPIIRQDMEQRFGRDFGHVRLHTDAIAVESAQAINALAYTVGQNIVFSKGRYTPGTRPGKRLLAHELAHVSQQSRSHGIEHVQGAIVQRQKGKPKDEGIAKENKGLVRLYEHRYRGHLITKYSIKGIDFLVGVRESMIGNIEANLDAIGAAIITGNKWIPDAALKVKTCIIAPSVTRYATYQDRPVIVLNPADSNSESTAHEIGHAIFSQYKKASGQPKNAIRDVGITITDIFLRLSRTKLVRDNERRTSGDVEQANHPAGLWIADPPQWSKNLASSEHPWEDADEFFASARKAYTLDLKGFRGAIDKFSKLDSNVKRPAKDLLIILSRLAAGKMPKMPKIISKDAEAEIARVSEPTKVESTLNFSIQEVLQWTLDPSTIPISKPPGPSLKSPISSSGQQLIARKLTHVLQRKPSGVRDASTRQPGPAEIAEFEADRRRFEQAQVEYFESIGEIIREQVLRAAGLARGQLPTTPDEALMVVRRWGITLDLLTKHLPQLAQSLSGRVQGQQATSKLAQQQSTLIAALTPNGKQTYQRVLARIKSEPFWRQHLDIQDIYIFPDITGTNRYSGYTNRASGQTAEGLTKTGFIIHISKDRLDAGQVEESAATLVHELSHTLYEPTVVERSLRSFTNDLAKLLADHPQIVALRQGAKPASDARQIHAHHIRQILYEKTGYAEAEIFVHLQQLTHQPPVQIGGQKINGGHFILGQVEYYVQQLKRIGLPQSILTGVIGSLTRRVAYLYDRRIAAEPQGSKQHRLLEINKEQALAILKIAAVD